MPWSLTDPVLQARHWQDPSGEAWVYPVRRGWALCDKAGSTRIFRSCARAFEVAMAPAFLAAKKALAQNQEALADLKAARTKPLNAARARGQALRWIAYWSKRLEALKEEQKDILLAVQAAPPPSTRTRSPKPRQKSSSAAGAAFGPLFDGQGGSKASRPHAKTAGARGK